MSRNRPSVVQAGCLAALLAVLLGLRLVEWQPFTLVRNNLFDWYQRLAPVAPNSGRVVVVDIDEASLAKLGQWPWPRTVMADLTRRLIAAGATVGFDILFAEPDRQAPLDPTTDAQFAEAIRAGRVVLGEAAEGNRPGMQSAAALAVSGASPGQLNGLTAFTGLLEPLPLLARAAAGRGVFSIGLDDGDGVFRHLPMVARVGHAIHPALALELVRVSEGGTAILLQAVARDAPDINRIVVMPKIVISTSWAGDVWLRFAISPLRTVSILDVLDGQLPAGSLADQIAVVGTSAVGLRDLRMTPVGPLPGVYLHAIALDNILSGSLLWRPTWCNAVELGLMLAAGLTVIGVAILGRRRGMIAAWLGAAMVAAGVSQSLFQLYGWLIDPAAAIITATTLVFASLLIDRLRTERSSAAAAG